MEKQKYYIPDIETGFKFEVSREVYEDYLALWEKARPTLEGLVGRVYLAGTVGELDGCKDLHKFFYNPPEYKEK